MTTIYLHPQGALFAARSRVSDAAAFADATNRAHNPWQAWQAIREAEELIAQATAMLAVTLAERGIDPITGDSARRLLTLDGDDLGRATPQQCKASDGEASGTGAIAVWMPSGDVWTPRDLEWPGEKLVDCYVPAVDNRGGYCG